MTPPQTRRPTVYLIAQPNLSRTRKPPNLKPLYDHGDVQVIIPQGDSPSHTPRRSMDVIEARLAHFDPEIDYIAWAGGDALSAMMVGMALVGMEIWCYRWLRYERVRLANGQRTDEGAYYVPVTIDLSDEEAA